MYARVKVLLLHLYKVYMAQKRNTIQNVQVFVHK